MSFGTANESGVSFEWDLSVNKLKAYLFLGFDVTCPRRSHRQLTIGSLRLYSEVAEEEENKKEKMTRNNAIQ